MIELRVCRGFSQLKILNLNNNSIRGIPELISKLVCLEELSLAYNHIEWIPSFVGRMSLLRKLNLSHNRISELEASLSGLCLNVLLVNNNYFTTIPSCYQKMVLGLELLSLDWFL